MSMTSGQAAYPGAGQGEGQATGAGGRSHLVAGARLTGDLAVPGLIEIGGRVEGRVTADAVVVEPQGSVEGEVEGASVAVRGEVNGRVVAGAVRLHATARVGGQVTYETLSIEPGAEVTAAFERRAARPG
jgi:cytoskeletal protein CcmA (bactofilin family)